MTTKITVSLPDDLVEDARRAVARGDARSVSAYVAEAMRKNRPALTVAEAFEPFFAEYGQPTEEEQAWVDEQLARIRSKDRR